MTKKIPEDIPGKNIVEGVCLTIGFVIGVAALYALAVIRPPSVELAEAVGGESRFVSIARLMISVLVPAFALRHIGLKYYIRKIKTHRKQRGQCPLCGYPKPNATATCPECGVSCENDY